MTKHYCDRCGREHHRLFKVGVTCCLYEFAPELGPYSDDGPQSGSWDTELCPDCLAWLQANWPFKGNWDRVLPGDEIRRTLYAPYKGGQLDQPVAETTGG